MALLLKDWSLFPSADKLFWEIGGVLEDDTLRLQSEVLTATLVPLSTLEMLMTKNKRRYRAISNILILILFFLALQHLKHSNTLR